MLAAADAAQYKFFVIRTTPLKLIVSFPVPTETAASRFSGFLAL
jgi:hypothetical protein